MVTTYCKPEDVVALLRLTDKGKKMEITEESFPSLQDMNRWINEAESYIDITIDKSWKNVAALEESHTNRGWVHVWGITCCIIELDFKGFLTFDNAEGDYINVVTTTTTENILLTRTAGSYMGDGEYFVDYTAGKIYLYGSITPAFGRGAVQVKYRRGESTEMPEVIRECATKLVALNFLTGEDYLHLMPDNPNALDISTKSQNFKDRIEKILDNFGGSLIFT